jgi:tetratricopeptide (TPR) repeat protein
VPLGTENERMAAVHAYFGDHDRAAEIYRRRIEEIENPARRVWMRENLAGVLVEAGEAAEARALYDGRKRIFGNPPHLEDLVSPWLLSRRAVATALAGDPAAARSLLDAALAEAQEPAILVNRAALRALDGDADGARSDLDQALAREPDLAAAWQLRAWLLEQAGDARGAGAARREAERLSRRAPRGFPYGVGDGFHLNGQRFLLVIEDGALALYRPARARGQ